MPAVVRPTKMASTKIVSPRVPHGYRVTLPEIPWRDVRIRFQWNYYDGIVSGVLVYRDLPRWFEAIDPDGYERRRTDERGAVFVDWYRDFIIVELSDAQYSEIFRRNELFREKVGTHWDYDENGQRVQGSLRPAPMHREFYAVQDSWPAIDLSRNRLIGWSERLMDSTALDEANDEP